MSDEQLLCVMAAIIYAGADDNEQSAGYTPRQCANRAAAILAEIRGRDAVLIGIAQQTLSESART
jgi:hypothetical protein